MNKLKTIDAENDLELAERTYKKIGGKQIVGHFRIKHPNAEAVTKYFLEDGSEVIENDEGRAAQWPVKE